MEIAAAVLVLIPRSQAFSGLFAVGIMTGASFFHTVSPLRIDPYGDGGRLFREACFTFLMGGFIALVRREELVAIARRLPPRGSARELSFTGSGAPRYPPAANKTSGGNHVLDPLRGAGRAACRALAGRCPDRHPGTGPAAGQLVPLALWGG
ncbi:hypothetical protein JYK14_18520 [Siccirubricoccus sp. KC 17139]|uniref:Uncharacterized protein n=1 Tax=Siccirubricoccus soli TaxID=2899147 RepID=A0ABT1D970_9PROT|nr:hypothetical protein [Siccirubricoccus soli]MCO6418142.1 hypothetical protein [Siccirubricoccus soli]MCP2684277.1 hypothetical protein [Siccirubricoccus soli]